MFLGWFTEINKKWIGNSGKDINLDVHKRKKGRLSDSSIEQKFITFIQLNSLPNAGAKGKKKNNEIPFLDHLLIS